jgi:diguanylate cyclase (GGDEF)-like protein
LVERLRWTAGLRLATASATLVAFTARTGHRSVSPRTLLLWTVIYLSAGVGVIATARLRRRFALSALTLALLLDGVYLGMAFHVLGGLAGPVPYFIALQTMGVSLLASFRTGTKLALWHSIVVLVVLEAEQTRVLHGVPGRASSALTHDYGLFLLGLWVATLMTATLAAGNERELRRRRRDAETLRDLGAQLERAFVPDRIAGLLGELGTSELGAEAAMVVLAATAEGVSTRLPSGWLLVRPGQPVAAGVDTPPADDPRSLLQRSQAGSPVLVRALSPESDSWLVSHLGPARNVLSCQISVDDTSVAWFVLSFGPRKRRRIDHRLVDTVVQAVAQAGMALGRAQLLDQLRVAAESDGLTGLANRRTFDAALSAELARAEGTFAVAIIDLDYFKRVNDTLGHLVGDEVLRRTAATLRTASRASDLVARYGGEEFAMVIPNVARGEAAEVGERIRSAIAGSGGEPPITCSIGIAIWPEDGSSAEALLGTADQALYRAKQGGRNRVVTHEPIPVQHATNGAHLP